MNGKRSAQAQNKPLKTISWALLGLAGLVGACASVDPRQVDVELEETLPQMQVTSYTKALGDLGLMTEIYDTPPMRIMSQPLGDNTGSSGATGYEIPRDITEVVKSTLNSIGGKVTFIPYDPSFIINTASTGYSDFQNKVKPDVVLTGGITEFDRGLVTIGQNTDVGLGGEFKGLPEDFPSSSVDMKYSVGQKRGLARLTLDFNLLDFSTMTGIPKINTVASMEVRKAMKEQELGISLFGQSFGGKGSIKKVQGRHAAVRLVVEFGIIQLVGKHLKLPYWRLLGPDAKPDAYVMEQIANYYRYMNRSEITAVVQGWLYLYGFDVKVTGQMDETTQNAIRTVCKDMEQEQDSISFKQFTYVYLNIPVSAETKRRMELASWR